MYKVGYSNMFFISSFITYNIYKIRVLYYMISKGSSSSKIVSQNYVLCHKYL